MEVYDEVKSGKDVRFDPWRHMKAIRKLLQHDLPIAKVSKKDALAFSSQMIKASSIMWPLVKPTKTAISQNVDSAIISPITGFKWLQKAE